MEQKTPGIPSRSGFGGLKVSGAPHSTHRLRLPTPNSGGPDMELLADSVMRRSREELEEIQGACHV